MTYKPKFTKKDYESPDGMVTTMWGNMMWTTLHIISFNYPVDPTRDDKKHYKEYILSLGNVLPCRYCRDNFRDNLKAVGFSDEVFKNRNTFSRFIYKLHNHVNKMLGKHVKISYNEVRDRFENFRANCDDELIHTSKENGCTKSMYKTKSKCVINMVPLESKQPSFKINQKCQRKK
jgi:hypothetical protein